LLSTSIQQRVELVDCVAEVISAAEAAHDFLDVAVVGDGRNFEDVRERELEFAVVGVFLEQIAQDFAGFGGVIGEERGLLLFDAVSALAAGEDGRVEGQIA
jgi:hypothetical protein